MKAVCGAVYYSNKLSSRLIPSSPSFPRQSDWMGTDQEGRDHHTHSGRRLRREEEDVTVATLPSAGHHNHHALLGFYFCLFCFVYFPARTEEVNRTGHVGGVETPPPSARLSQQLRRGAVFSLSSSQVCPDGRRAEEERRLFTPS